MSVNLKKMSIENAKKWCIDYVNAEGEQAVFDCYVDELSINVQALCLTDHLVKSYRFWIESNTLQIAYLTIQNISYSIDL